jgi:hypothetical protein
VILACTICQSHSVENAIESSSAQGRAIGKSRWIVGYMQHSREICGPRIHRERFY